MRHPGTIHINITFHTPSSPKLAVGRQSYLTDEDLVVVLVCVLAQSICHVGDPVSQMVHSVFTANAGDETKRSEKA